MTAEDWCLEGAKCRLLHFGLEHRDNPAYLGWLRDPMVVTTLNLPAYLEPVAFETIAAYCAAMMVSESDLFCALVRKADDGFVGTVKAGGIDTYHGTADLGVMIGARDAWGQGLASDALHTLARHLFEARGLRKLTGGAMAINPGMVRVFEKLGFREEGRFRGQDRHPGGICDHLHFGCFADELRDPA